MLTLEDNELLTRVGPGTPMGQLLRRYWMPALLSTEIATPDSPPVRVRLMGEDLVAFRDTDGKVGLLDQHCPHRRASLFFGRNEESGLRCVYHGWKFDVEGRCVDMPSEPSESNFKGKVMVTSYPTYERGGVVWAYLGPEGAVPPYPSFEVLTLPEDRIMASKTHTCCNYIQAMEGNIDSSHVSYLHSTLEDLTSKVTPGADEIGFVPDEISAAVFTALRVRGFARNPRLELQPTSYGFRYAGIRSTPAGHQHIRITTQIFPLYNMVARLPVQPPSLAIHVPIDDQNSWRWSISGRSDKPMSEAEQEITRLSRIAPDSTGHQQQNKANDYLLDREYQRTTNFTGIQGIQIQDLAVTESMGGIVDRSREHLGSTDAAIIYFRRMLLQGVQDMLEGKEPPQHDPDITVHVRAHEEVIPGNADWREHGTYAGESVEASV